MSAFGYLVDTSAFIRLSRDPNVGELWRSQIGAGALAICPLTELEVLHGARSKADMHQLRKKIDAAYPWVVMPDRIFERARNVQESLSFRGTHRSASAVDLLIAATAEEHGLTLLHYDTDFVQVADVTGQPIRWLADPGSID